jgi:hypothetical protein
MELPAIPSHHFLLGVRLFSYWKPGKKIYEFWLPSIPGRCTLGQVEIKRDKDIVGMKIKNLQESYLTPLEVS